MAEAGRLHLSCTNFSVLALLGEAHASGAGILDFLGLSMREARGLRLVSREFLNAVASFP